MLWTFMAEQSISLKAPPCSDLFSLSEVVKVYWNDPSILEDLYSTPSKDFPWRESKASFQLWNWNKLSSINILQTFACSQLQVGIKVTYQVWLSWRTQVTRKRHTQGFLRHIILWDREKRKVRKYFLSGRGMEFSSHPNFLGVVTDPKQS